jgi:hypothetical protein
MFTTRGKTALLGIGTMLLAGICCTPTGQAKAAALSSKLQGPITASWLGQQLHEVLNRLAASQQVVFWLDRNVDPQQLVNAQFSDATFAEVLDQLTEAKSLGWTTWEEVVYLGPPGVVQELATLAAIARESVSRLPPAMQQRWLKAETVSWPRLSDPRDILSSWLASNEVRLTGRELLSHDLWDAKQLPAMPLVDRVVFLLAGFGMTCDISDNGQVCRVVRLEQPVFITREYAAGNQAGELAEEFKQNPRVVLGRSGNKVSLTGKWEDHQRAAEILRSNSTTAQSNAPPPRIKQNVFSLKLENQPVGKVIDQFARQLRLEVAWNANATTRDTLVSCDVTNVSLEELLAAVLAPAGLEFKLSGKRLEVVAGK